MKTLQKMKKTLLLTIFLKPPPHVTTVQNEVFSVHVFKNRNKSLHLFSFDCFLSRMK